MHSEKELIAMSVAGMRRRGIELSDQEFEVLGDLNLISDAQLALRVKILQGLGRLYEANHYKEIMGKEVA
jgi:hypothetical protein